MQVVIYRCEAACVLVPDVYEWPREAEDMYGEGREIARCAVSEFPDILDIPARLLSSNFVSISPGSAAAVLDHIESMRGQTLRARMPRAPAD